MHKRFRLLQSTILGAVAACAIAYAPAVAQPADGQPADGPSSADTSVFYAGVYAGYHIVQHDATLIGIPDVPTCSPGFHNGSGSGNGFGALGSYWLSPKLSVQLRLGYSTSTGRLAARETFGNAVQDGKVVPAISEHFIEPTFGSVNFEPRVVVSPFAFPLSINVGLEYGLVMTKTFVQGESIVSPSNVKFYQGLTRNRVTGEIPGVSSPTLSLVGGVGYDIRLTRRLTLTPELSYHRGLTKVIPDTSWNISSVQFGVAIRMSIGGPKDTTSDKPALTAAVVANKQDAESFSGSIPKMRVEEFVSPQLRPLLNYVFFDPDSSKLSDRYVKLSSSQRRRFDLSSLQNFGVMPTYYHLLNVIGYRLQENSGATITLTGCNTDEGSERGKTDLSRQRAEEVRNYLRDTWGIDESRMKVEARNLPEKPSSSSSTEGREENRRVEIRSSIPEILEPVFTVDTTLTTDPNGVRFSTTVTSEAGIRSWKLTALQGGSELKSFSGTGEVPATLDWNLQDERPSIPRGAQQVEYRLEVTDQEDQHAVSPTGTIGVEQVTVKRKREEGMADREINRFSLILFEYGKSDISDANKRIVDFIKGRIAPNAKVKITGHTDRAGDASVNQRLSEERARAVGRALGVPGADVKGLGESLLLYNNDLPEGRFYCRVVNVLVETQIGN